MKRWGNLISALVLPFALSGCVSGSTSDGLEEYCLSLDEAERAGLSICDYYVDAALRAYCMSLPESERFSLSMCAPYVVDAIKDYCMSLPESERATLTMCVPYLDPDQPVICTDSCPEGELSCSGFYTLECARGTNGCLSWSVRQTCSRPCIHGKCGEALPDCQAKHGSPATLIQVTDGDTIWAMVSGDDCNPTKRNLRIHGIDAPECTKIRNAAYYWECTPDSKYTNDNEPYGYESFLKAKQLLESGPFTITCDSPSAEGVCPVDAYGSRQLAYLAIVNNGVEVDFSTEMARLGLAFSFTAFSSSKRAAICAAQFEAQNKRVGVWSLASLFNGVMALMSMEKRQWLRSNQSICNAAIK